MRPHSKAGKGAAIGLPAHRGKKWFTGALPRAGQAKLGIGGGAMPLHMS
jgi:hypothetical protein